jgi:hypothetical protein
LTNGFNHGFTFFYQESEYRKQKKQLTDGKSKIHVSVADPGTHILSADNLSDVSRAVEIEYG